MSEPDQRTPSSSDYVLMSTMTTEKERKQTAIICQTISHHRVLEKLGEGRTGVEYRAEDLQLKRLPTLKLLPKSQQTYGIAQVWSPQNQHAPTAERSDR